MAEDDPPQPNLIVAQRTFALHLFLFWIGLTSIKGWILYCLQAHQISASAAGNVSVPFLLMATIIEILILLRAARKFRAVPHPEASPWVIRNRKISRLSLRGTQALTIIMCLSLVNGIWSSRSESDVFIPFAVGTAVNLLFTYASAVVWFRNIPTRASLEISPESSQPRS